MMPSSSLDVVAGAAQDLITEINIHLRVASLFPFSLSFT